MLFTLSPDLVDGLTLIGLISLMAAIICPLFTWVLTANFGQPDAVTTFRKTTI
ncbi:MAG: hypothetical protein F6K09_40260 [Merismopedia sp. SIO2A8]|nr:hypothetical protein [Merismopedia sp. SIO2A8]